MDDPLFIEPKFDKSDTITIIQLYKSHPVLWDIKDPLYRRQNLKALAYNDIAKQMHMSVESVKKKLKSLRSTYTGEKRKMFYSKNKPDGEKYITSLSWYNEMRFLDSLSPIRKPVESIIDISSEISQECESKVIASETVQILNPAKLKVTPTLSSQVLDTSSGKGAANVDIVLYRLLENEYWQELKVAFTDENGCSKQLLDEEEFQSGFYKLRFDIYKYFLEQGKTCVYPFIEIVLACEVGLNYFLPLHVSQFSYSTYTAVENN